ncbi:terminal protein TpgL [Streptomyces azureus]|uniref:Terminal protein TpgL n=1 Tax=Streptomyces azureus TaxID=146537 RepID=A0A0K8PI48_STRAJ|nr:terminal protein TpgL [Streptomyces azureus]
MRARWQPRVRERARRQAATSTGLVVDTRARFGFTAAPGTTDDARIRHLTPALPPQHAARLFDAQDAGASEQQLRHIASEGLGEMYFRDGGRRALGLEVEFTDVEHIQFDI